MDPLMLLILLIPGCTGPDSVFSVKWMSVQSGGSVTIPCLYKDTYKNHVKYWCRGKDQWSCTTIVRTDSPQTKGDVSIRDDSDQQVFTVTMNHLTFADDDFYWCCVEISGHSDIRHWVLIKVIDLMTVANETHSSPRLSVDKQKVTGVEGGSVSVQCRYGHRSSEMKWCKIRGSCVSVNSGSLDGTPVEIMADRVNEVFRVTMRGLERKDTGWYWCYDGYNQIPVYITVNPAATTTTTTELPTVNQKTTTTTTTEQTVKASATGLTTKMLLQTDSAHDGGGSNETERWQQVLGAVLKAGTGVFYLICTIIAIQLHCSSCRKRGSNQREEGGANTNHVS
ncbi:polymeric immunoglobulin receptor-like [Brienomyrus brachyistius]|uniref:polymeric immunoglobulin receptor-like n=1 Tax=Brienomyrus brachyistius TaxID=42636 RepID=UPI0020B3889F|nr:polymeric immunoglobulin receptor-like [Brienomyrus brachyistius]